MNFEQPLNKRKVLPAAARRRLGRRGMLLAAAVVLSLAAAGCKRQGGAPAAVPPTVRVQKPERVRRPWTVAASGTVEGSLTAELAFQVAGRVARVLVEEGQAVRRGQPLAELEAADYEYGLQAAEAQAAAARANQEKAEAGVRGEELEQARAAYARAEDEYNRYRRLFERRSMAPADFAKVEAAYRAAKAQLEMAQNGARREDRSAAAAALRQALAQVEVSRKRVADTRLTSPMDGVVARRGIDPGEMAGAGLPVFSIAALNPAWVRVGVPETDVGRVRKGQRAVIVVPALGGRTFNGTVELVGVAADPASRTFTAKLSVPNPGLLLKAGMIAEAGIIAEGTVDVLTVPGEAIVRDPQGATLVYVYYPDDGSVHARRVETGQLVSRNVEIASGLSAEDLVVVAGQHRLREGTRVEVAR